MLKTSARTTEFQGDDTYDDSFGSAESFLAVFWATPKKQAFDLHIMKTMETQEAQVYKSNQKTAKYWRAVKELQFSYHNSKTILFTIYPDYGILYELP